MMNYNKIKSIFENKEYRFFEGIYNVNLFGIRSKDRTPDIFNDTLGLAYVDEFKNPIILTFKGTTDPGAYYLKDKSANKQGTAILIPGQYNSCFEIGKHKGYEALIQSSRAKFKVWRDNNKDGKLDFKGSVYENVSGLNLHTTSFLNEIEKVGPYSAGCQVIKNDKDFEILLSVVKRSSEKYGTRFTYTLFDENNLTL